MDSVAVVPLEDGNMQTLAERFLTVEEQKRVTKTVQRMEKQTSGEIVPMVVSESHSYPMAAAAGGTLLSLPLALLLTSFTGSYLWLGSQNMWLLLVFFSLLYFPLRLLVASIPWLKRIFLLSGQVDEEVQEAATTAFFAEGLFRTRDENGILLFVSVLEKKVWILGDRGINEKIHPSEWQDIIAELTEGIQKGQHCQALCTAVTHVGNVLREHFPIREGDHDELHNIIIR